MPTPDRTFTVSDTVERNERYKGDLLWSESSEILDGNGKHVGTIWRSDRYDSGQYQYTCRQLVWRGELPPLGLGFDGAPFVTKQDALAAFERVANEVLDWREGKRVRSIYSKTGWYQR